MKKLIYALAAILTLIVVLFATHIAAVAQKKHDIAPEFQPIYESFLQEAKSRGFKHLNLINISIHFNDLNQVPKEENKTTLGECRLIIGMSPKIMIDRQSWNRMNSAQKEMTIFHELGHCFLLKGHTDAHNHQIISLMNSNMFDSNLYLRERNNFLNEMFSYKAYHVRDYSMTFFLDPATKSFKRWVKLNFNK